MKIFGEKNNVQALEEKIKTSYILKKTFIEFKELSSKEQDDAIKELDDAIKKYEEELERIK